MRQWVERNPDVAPSTIAASLDFGRPHYPCRAAVPFETAAELGSELEALAARIDGGEERVAPTIAPKIAWCYAGQGLSLKGAAAKLYGESDVVARAIDHAESLLAPRFAVPVRHVLVEAGFDPVEPRFVQPISVALQLALTELWTSMGLKPVVALGHSIGEISAASAVSLVTSDSALLFTAARGEAMERLCAEGAMLAVRAGRPAVEKLLAPLALGSVSIAACNSPTVTVIAGTPTDIGAADAAFGMAGMATTLLQVSRAYHNALVDPAIGAIGEASRLLVPGSGSNSALISSLTGTAVASSGVLDPSRWQDHARQPVLFEDAVREALSRGVSAWLEIGAEPQLALHVRSIAADTSVWSTLDSRDKSLRAVLNAGRGLYAAGAAIDLVDADPKAVRVPVSGYAFQRDRYWLDRTDGAAARPSGAHTWTFSVGPQLQPYLADHRIGGRVVVPGTFYIDLAMAATREVFAALGEVSDITFHQALILGEDDIAELRLTVVSITAGSAVFSIDRIAENQVLRISSGKLTTAEGDAAVPRILPRATAPEMAADSFYATVAAGGLEYGPTFRGIVSLRCDLRGAIGDVRVLALSADEMAAYALHPAVLDCCLQVAGAIVAAGPVRITRYAYLPVGVQRVRALRAIEPGSTLHVVAERREMTDADRIPIDIEIYDKQGLIAVVDKFTIGKVGATEMNWQGRAAFHKVEWPELKPGKARDCALVVVAPSDGEFAGRLQAALRVEGIQAVIADAACPLVRAQEGGSSKPRRIAYVTPRAEAVEKSLLDRLWKLCEPLLALVRSIPRGEGTTALSIVTRCALSLSGEACDPIQAGVWGCGTSIISERPDLDVRLIDLNGSEELSVMAVLATALVADSDENRIAIRHGKAFVQRLDAFAPQSRPAEDVSHAVLRLESERPGSIDELAFKSLPKPRPDRDEVLIRIEAAALNFLDVLAALGERPDLPPGPCTVLGSECAGIVEAVGADVRDVVPGDRVVAISPGSIATHVIAKAVNVHKYSGLTAVEACALPICYGTAEYSLRTIGRLAPGENVLIHSATGGVGLAAISIAREIGARILATAGSAAKRQELVRRGIADVFDSRSAAFVDGVRNATNGRGADVVLNALANPLLEAGIDAMGQFGRFIDIAKRDIYAEGSIGLSPFRRNLSYSAFDLGRLYVDRPNELRSLIAGVLRRVQNGIYERLPITPYAADAAVEAFQLMARTRHIGKIVIDFTTPPQPTPRSFAAFRADAAYVISGGFGALGLTIAARMVQGGARHLVLLGRRGASAEAEAILGLIRTTGCAVTALALDVTDAKAVEEALRAIAVVRPIAGVVHAAGVLDDGPIEEMTRERFQRVAAPKIDGFLALAAILKPDALDFFVVFSSTSAIFAPPLQTSYAAANAAMETLARGAGARVIAWGAWTGGGMATRSGTAMFGQALGLPPILAADGSEAFSRFLATELEQCAVFASNPEYLDRGARQFGAAPLLGRLISARQTARGDAALLASLAAHETPQARIDALAAHLAGEIATVLGTSADQFSLDQDFRNLGIDSLTALQLAKRIERRLGITLDPTAIALHPTIAGLASIMAAKLGLVDEAAPAAAPAPKQPARPEAEPAL
jgi:NADPH:quinone reductase-like Zn-dependent oxidoreductase/acyl carrier protein